MVAKSGASTVKPALLIGPKMVNNCFWQNIENGRTGWLRYVLGEGESVVLVLWVASQVGRESGNSHAWVSFQACFAHPIDWLFLFFCTHHSD